MRGRPVWVALCALCAGTAVLVFEMRWKAGLQKPATIPEPVRISEPLEQEIPAVVGRSGNTTEMKTASSKSVSTNNESPSTEESIQAETFSFGEPIDPDDLSQNFSVNDGDVIEFGAPLEPEDVFLWDSGPPRSPVSVGEPIDPDEFSVLPDSYSPTPINFGEPLDPRRLATDAESISDEPVIIGETENPSDYQPNL